MRRKTKKTIWGIFGAVLLTAGAIVGGPGSALAFELGKVQIHGYGHQGFLLADENAYLKADDEGTWDYNEFALVFSAKVTDNTSIWGQLHGTSESVRVHWAFVDHQLSNALRVRAGQIKLPLGIYNEIRDTKFLFLSTLEPAMYQEASEMIHESFRGVSAVYTRDVGSGSITLDAYGGEPVADAHGEMGHAMNQMLGGRITYQTPIEGLSLMGSAVTMKAEESDTGETGTSGIWIASANYVNHGLDLEAEYARMKILGHKSNTYYVQAGYTLWDKLTPFVRYEYITTDEDEESDPSYYQKDVTMGLGYKINYNVSLKAEYHVMRGYALPVASGEVTAGAGKKDWNLFVASINFVF